MMSQALDALRTAIITYNILDCTCRGRKTQLMGKLASKMQGNFIKGKPQIGGFDQCLDIKVADSLQYSYFAGPIFL